MSETIPREIALQLCSEIRREKEHKLFSQCWGCMKFSKGDVSKMCVGSRPDYRGCKLINDVYDKARKSQ